ncbi:hypothetical protein GALL_426510 [mine drainage metagenome]|uniref:Uncharacterized protein n=1 Tax=mine drainage metagenome TaxID=410659 RepID=A0A1J5PVT1_9ZZZZ
MRRIWRQTAFVSLLPQNRDDPRHVRWRERRQDHPVDQRGRLLIGHADVAGPLQRELAVRRGFAHPQTQPGLKGVRNLLRTVHQRNGRPGKADSVASPGFAVEESVEGHHIVDFDRVDAQARGGGPDGIVADVAETMLYR